MIAAPAPGDEAATGAGHERSGEHHDGRVGPKKVRQFDEHAERGVRFCAEILQHCGKLRQHE